MRGRRTRKLLGRIRRLAPGGADGTPARSRERGAQGHALDWRAALARLGPLRHRWDLAIICNLDEATGRRPADLLTAINSQAGAGRRLSPQVLSGRLRELERDGYIRHEDLSVMPLHRVYFLQLPGQALISDLTLIIGAGRPASYVACAIKPQ